MGENKKKRKLPFLWTDILLATVLTAASFLFPLAVHSSGAGSSVTVTIDGESERYSLLTDREIDTQGAGMIVIRGGKVHLENSTCPDGLCEAFGEIGKSGESIVCVPNKLVITVNGEGEVDGIAG